MRFVQIPTLAIGGSGQWILAGELIYESDLAGTIVVPEGFETDLASIPRIFTPLIPKNGKHRAAAIVHDWLCRMGAVKRRTADRVFLEAMKHLDEARWRRWSMYSAVRVYSLWLQLIGKAK